MKSASFKETCTVMIMVITTVTTLVTMKLVVVVVVVSIVVTLKAGGMNIIMRLMKMVISFFTREHYSVKINHYLQPLF